MQAWQIFVLFSAAYVAGVMNALAGGGTIITFPALLWIGLDPIVANTTSTVALLPGALSSFFGYRKEVSGSRRWAKLFILPSFVGGLIGAILLLFTPSKFFAAIVPFLILFATVLFALQEPLTKRLRQAASADKRLAGAEKESRDQALNHHPGTQSPQKKSGAAKASKTRNDDDAKRNPHFNNISRNWLIGAVVMQFMVSIYGGYFGAGVGILMLATLGLMGLTDIHQMNGLKNLLGFSINSIAAFSFMVSGQVKWSAAIVMAIAAILGGYSGASLARKFGRAFARRAVIAIGLIMTLSLFFNR